MNLSQLMKKAHESVKRQIVFGAKKAYRTLLSETMKRLYSELKKVLTLEIMDNFYSRLTYNP